MIFDFEKGFNDEATLKDSMPIIAISANIIDENSALHFAYTQAIVDAGGVPLIVPANCTGRALSALMRGVDGVLFSGGADIDAGYFNQENIEGLTEISEQRDYYEFQLLRVALDWGVPILGICRGCQLVNVALGGSLFQDLPSIYPTKPLDHSVLTNKHLPVHSIEIEQDSLLYKIVGQRTIGVNTRHHQAIDRVAEGLRVVARSEDGVVEAVEGLPHYNIIAMQCHPENLATTGGSVAMQRLFAHFVAEAELYMRAKEIHRLNPIVDSHCDTPMLYTGGGFDFSERCSAAQVDSVKMREGLVDATITVAYISQTTPKEEATAKAFSLLKSFREDVLRAGIEVVSTVEGIFEAKARGARSVMLGVENGLAVGDDIENVDGFFGEGVVYITLCHNGTNDICDSAIGETIYDGVSQFGARVIERMNSLGVTVDVSHSSHKSTMEALRLSTQPVIASHSSCKALCDHPRNLSDEAICAIVESGGVVQVCGYDGFLRNDGKATIIDLVAHIEHVVKLTGYDGVGVGSDFDGGGGIVGFDGANRMVSLTVELLRRGHLAEDVAKIMGGNICRILKNNSR